jgi:hypothetical protein
MSCAVACPQERPASAASDTWRCATCVKVADAWDPLDASDPMRPRFSTVWSGPAGGGAGDPFTEVGLLSRARTVGSLTPPRPPPRRCCRRAAEGDPGVADGAPVRGLVLQARGARVGGHGGVQFGAAVNARAHTHACTHTRTHTHNTLSLFSLSHTQTHTHSVVCRAPPLFSCKQHTLLIDVVRAWAADQVSAGPEPRPGAPRRGLLQGQSRTLRLRCAHRVPKLPRVQQRRERARSRGRLRPPPPTPPGPQ